MSSWLGRGVALTAIAIKVVVVVAGLTLSPTPALEYLDRFINFFLLVLAAIWIYRLTRLARSGVLWSVSRKLILSYILVGAVPILLLLTFSLLAFLLVFFDISSYLVRNRFNDLAGQAATFARTTLFEVERTPVQNRADVISRRQNAIRARYPGASVTLVRTEGNPGCGVPSSDGLSSTSDALPRWVSCRGFNGMMTDGVRMIARAAALPDDAAPQYAVIVDLLVDDKLASVTLEGTGIQLGQDRPRSLFNTATFVTHTEWQTGVARQATIPLSVDVAALYRWLGSSQGDANFNRVLLFVLLGIGALLLVIEMVALGNGLALARSITASVDDLFHGTVRVKGGDFDQAIAVRSEDQLGELAASFNDMTGRIQGLLLEQNEKRRLEEELRIARTIQMSLLPQGRLSVPGLSIGGLCAPAREVGGDYYDFFELGEGRIALLIADVAGKGTSAALYMAELKGLMLSLSRIHTSPRDLLIEADGIIRHHLSSQSFITMIYAVVDLRARSLTCARAGHTPFIRIPAAPLQERRARVLAPDGMVLGLNLDKGARFARSLKEVTLPLQEGDVFFFFTDGISEAMDGTGECFGESRLTAFLEANTHLTVEEIRDGVLEQVGLFVAGQPQHDDITMVILKVDAGQA